MRKRDILATTVIMSYFLAFFTSILSDTHICISFRSFLKAFFLFGMERGGFEHYGPWECAGQSTLM